MKFTDLNGQEFELSILGYEFSAITDNEYDANWLNIQIKVKSEIGKWKKQGPYLLTWEVNNLVWWLNDIITNKKFENSLFFIEQNLVFEKTKKRDFNIKIYFQSEFEPEGWNKRRAFYINFKLTKENLNEMMEELKKELIKFPYRKTPDSLPRFSS